MKIKFYSEGFDEWLCFTHAVQRAMQGEQIEAETDRDDFASECDMRDTSCVDCREEEEKP